MSWCRAIQLAGLAIALTDLLLNFTGIFLSSAVLLYGACYNIKCKIPVTEAIVKEVHREFIATHAQDETEKELLETIESEFWPLVLFIILCLNQVAFDIILACGVRKEDIHKVKVWLVFKSCVVIIGIFLILTQDSIGQGVYRQVSEILYVFLTLFYMCIAFIMYDVLHRRKRQYRNNNRSGRLITS